MLWNLKNLKNFKQDIARDTTQDTTQHMTGLTRYGETDLIYLHMDAKKNNKKA